MFRQSNKTSTRWKREGLLLIIKRLRETCADDRDLSILVDILVDSCKINKSDRKKSSEELETKILGWLKGHSQHWIAAVLPKASKLWGKHLRLHDRVWLEAFILQDNFFVKSYIIYYIYKSSPLLDVMKQNIKIYYAHLQINIQAVV